MTGLEERFRSNPWSDLTPPYSTIVADPPWHQKGTGSAYGAITRPGYSYLSVDEIVDLPVESLAGSDARLFVWVTNHNLRHVWRVAEQWGFTPLRVLTWCKPRRGVLPVNTEFILIAKRGSPPRLPWCGSTWFDWPLQPIHSQKPPPFFDLVESWCPGPYVELFARSPRLGWDSWGYGWEQAS